MFFVPGSCNCRFSLDLRVHRRKVSSWCSRVGINFHTSVLQTPRISEYCEQHITIPAFFFVSPPNAAARHHRCIVAHDVFSRSRVETEPASVHPVHSEFLLWSSSLVWLEQDLLTERSDLLIKWFASDAFMSCLMSSMSMLHDVQAISKLSC